MGTGLSSSVISHARFHEELWLIHGGLDQVYGGFCMALRSGRKTIMAETDSLQLIISEG